MKKILFIMVFLMMINTVSATVYHAEGSGDFKYNDASSEIGNVYNGDTYVYYSSASVTVVSGVTLLSQVYDKDASHSYTVYDGSYNCYTSSCTYSESGSYSGTWNDTNTNNVGGLSLDGGQGFDSGDNTYTYSHTLITSDDIYTISGAIGCINTINLYINNTGDWVNLVSDDVSGDSTYSYNISNGYDYSIKYDDVYYNFTCTGNEVYNYDLCVYCTINIQDNCANLLNGAFTVIYNKDDNMSVVYSGYNNPINLLSTEVNETEELIVLWSTWYDAIHKTCYAQFDYPINLYDQLVYWNMDVYVYDNASNPIEGANVDFNQDCVINGYPTRNKYTDSNGMVEFTQCENDNADLTVSKDGYKTLSTSISGGWYDAYTSTYQVSVILQSSDSDNSSTWNLINDSINDANATETPDDIPDVGGVPSDVIIYFRNTKGDYVTQINDTDDYVRCYYSVNTPNNVNMSLVFQKSYSGYYFYDVDTYLHTIDNNSYGYFNIPNSYFNDSTYSYRAYIYDTSYPFDDRYAYLNVVNQTSESETHYENLTSYCMFMNTNKNGSIDYREDIICYAMIISDNTSLRTVSMELYDNSTLLEYKNLTNSSYDTDDIYGWYLGYNYTLNHNYSLVLKGYDNSILDVDNVMAYNLIGNKLTIKVTDSFNHDLTNVYVFCEHYGSINTGYLNYGAFEGLPDDETRYKASKSGYRSGAWKTINLTSENKIVTYQLTQEQIESSVSEVRMSDDNVKDLYYPFMYFLMIIILIGGLMHVIK